MSYEIRMALFTLGALVVFLAVCFVAWLIVEFKEIRWVKKHGDENDEYVLGLVRGMREDFRREINALWRNK